MLPSDSAGKALTAVVYGKGDYLGSTVSIPAQSIAATTSGATTLSMMLKPLEDASTPVDIDTGVDTTTGTVTETPTTGGETTTAPDTGSPVVTDTSVPVVTDAQNPVVTDTGSTDTSGQSTSGDTGATDGTAQEPVVTDTAPVYSVMLTYKTTTIAAGTVLTAVPDPLTDITTYQWYINGVLQELNNGLTTYTVTDDDVTLNHKLRLDVVYSNAQIASTTLYLGVKTTTTE